MFEESFSPTPPPTPSDSPPLPAGFMPTTGMRTDVRLLPHVTVVDNLYFQPPKAQPTTPGESRYTYHTVAEVDPYVRTAVKVGRGMAKIDIGWVENASALWIQNLEGTDRSVIPSAAEMTKHNSRVVELFVSVEANGETKYVRFLRVRPGHSVRFEPTSDVFARLAETAIGDEPTRIMLAVIPEAVDPVTMYDPPKMEGVVVERGSYTSRDKR